MTGYHVGKIGGGDRAYTLYFAAQFDRPFQSAKTWMAGAIDDATRARGKSCGAILTFDTATNPAVQVRVGISYVSVANAKANLAAENPAWNFSTIRQKANAAWNAILNRVQIAGGTDEQRHTFYTALYHCFLQPNWLEDGNGEYPGMDDKFTGSTQAAINTKTSRLGTTGAPTRRSSRFWRRTKAATSRNRWSITRCRTRAFEKMAAACRAGEQVNRNSGGMVGDGDDAIISSAYAFGARRFDAKAALAAMDKGASEPGTTSDGAQVREGLKDYLALGYVPGEASVTLEYCNNDFALAQFARALGDTNACAVYLNRAQNWTNLFDDATGWIRPRNADGAWMANFSAASSKGFVEGTAAQYVWMVNFDLPGLIDKMGGNDKAVQRLDHFFTKLNSSPFSGDTAYMGNEPCEEAPWIYDFAGAPAHTQEVVRRIQSELFTGHPNGLPGNDDAGALSSWYVFSALGLYPEIPGVAGFVVGSPLFPEATIHLENGSAIRILGQGASSARPYVQSLELDGQACVSPWISWSALANGAALNFNLGDRPSPWGKNQTPRNSF